MKKQENTLLIGIGMVMLLLAAGKRSASVGAITKVKPPGKTQCRDGNFSTFQRSGGVCSYHGGIAQAVNHKKKAGQSTKRAPLPSMIHPDKTVKAGIQKAIENVLSDARSRWAGQYKPMSAAIFYRAFANNNVIEIPAKDGLQSSVLKSIDDDLIEAFGYTSAGVTHYEITPRGKELRKAIEGRLQTLRNIKSGTDLFPEIRGFQRRIFIKF